MDDGLLRKWLGLQPGPWPPEDREVLGLPAGPADPAAVELRALEQMDRLRPHQLRHPELVTEGMNRLAKAMIALTAGGAAPSAPPPKHRKPSKRKSRPAEVLPENLALSSPDLPIPAAKPAVSVPEILDAEIVVVEPPAQALHTEVDPGEPVPVPELPPPGTAYVPEDRRRSYRELVELRRVIRSWDRLRSTLAVPGEPFATPVKVLNLLEASGELRRLLPDQFPAVSGRLVLAVLQHELPLGVIRTLVPSQRLALATDWAKAAAELRQRYATIRAGLHRSIPRRRANRLIRRSLRWLRGNPEWILILAALGLFALGLARVGEMIQVLDINSARA